MYGHDAWIAFGWSGERCKWDSHSPNYRRSFKYEMEVVSHVIVCVSDTGTGMDTATLDRIFEPFFTTKEIGKGTGLGLPTVYGIVKQHDGFLDVHSERGRGPPFILFARIRRNYRATEIASRGVRYRRAGNGPGAEDNEALRELAAVVLGSSGYKVILASNGREALRLFKANSDEIQVVVLDVVMPQMSGPDVYGQMVELRKDVPVIFTTGHSAERASLVSSLESEALFLQKPYLPQVLSRAVRSALNRRQNRE